MDILTNSTLLFGNSLSMFLFCESTKLSMIFIYAIRCLMYVMSNIAGYERFYNEGSVASYCIDYVVFLLVPLGFLSSFSNDFSLLIALTIVIVVTTLQKVKFSEEKLNLIAENEIEYSLSTPSVKPIITLYMILMILFGENEKYGDSLNYILESCLITYILFGITFSSKKNNSLNITKYIANGIIVLPMLVYMMSFTNKFTSVYSFVLYAVLAMPFAKIFLSNITFNKLFTMLFSSLTIIILTYCDIIHHPKIIYYIRSFFQCNMLVLSLSYIFIRYLRSLTALTLIKSTSFWLYTFILPVLVYYLRFTSPSYPSLLAHSGITIWLTYCISNILFYNILVLQQVYIIYTNSCYRRELDSTIIQISFFEHFMFLKNVNRKHKIGLLLAGMIYRIILDQLYEAYFPNNSSMLIYVPFLIMSFGIKMLLLDFLLK